MQKPQPTLDSTLGRVSLLLLLGGCLLVLRPFVSALLWAVVLTVSCWPIYKRLLRLVGSRPALASLFMTLAIMTIVLLPFVVVGATLADNVHELKAAAKRWIESGPPAPPEWLAKTPVIGAQAADYWRTMAADTAKLRAEAQPLLEKASSWLLHAGLALSRGVIELALSIFIAFFLFRDGVSAAERLSIAIEGIAGEAGKHLLNVASKTVRGVVYGILGTALAQALLGGVGYLIAGLPGAALLALLTFFASVVPVVGTTLVWLPAALWLFHQGATGWGIFMLIWGFGVAHLDNIVKPWLISQGSNMPFILIFFGVVGGALAFGFIGVFLGPTLLAVGFKVVEEWIASRRPGAGGNSLQPASREVEPRVGDK